MKKATAIEIKFRRLGRERAFGLAWCDDRVIEIDETAHEGDELKLMDTIIHEVLHIARPRLCERTVAALADELSRTLFQVGYRRTHTQRSNQRTDNDYQEGNK
jgi:hypothetical protein